MNCNNEYLGKYISLIHRQANVFFTKEFSKFGFGSGQYMFLIHLYKNDGISQEELSELVNIDKGTTAKAIRRLEELNLIKRLKDSTDKRINRIYLTTKAINIKDEFFYILTKWENMLTKNLSSEEFEYALQEYREYEKGIKNKDDSLFEMESQAQ